MGPGFRRDDGGEWGACLSPQARARERALRALRLAVDVVDHEAHAFVGHLTEPAHATAGAGFGCLEIASAITAAMTQSVPAMKKAGR